MIFSEQTIIAQCTPQGSGALALLRLSGNNAINIVCKISMLSNKHKLSVQKTHTVHYGHVIDNNHNLVDQVMFIIMKAPQTFTGENIIEITCHNNPFIIDQIISLAINHGARLAQRGEFAQRAFLNNKIDLTQAEAINSLIHAHTEQALKKSLAQLKGNLSHWIESIERKLLKCTAFSEASFEFIDEDMDFAPKIKFELEDIISSIKKIKESFNIQQQIKEGLRIAIIGSVNAGKSSLFNALVKKERAIVTHIAGTTRDSIEAGIYTKQHYITIIDTAGLRKTDNHIEKIGIERSFTEAQSADIILLTFDSSKKISQVELDVYQDLLDKYTEKTILVYNKCDQETLLKLPKQFDTKISISTKTKIGIEKLEDLILSKIDQIVSKDVAPFLLNQRQFNVLSSVSVSVSEILKMLAQPEYELISLHLNETLQNLSALSGKSISEKGMDAIFKEFCVGK
jgi:tRNA modification GTPase